MTKHIEGKLEVESGRRRGWFVQLLCQGLNILRGGSFGEAKANAEHLAKCWNCHDELLTACKKGKKVFKRMKDCGCLQADGMDALPILENAVAKAEKS